MNINLMMLGCPVANGETPCNHLCGGGWPGTKITHTAMLLALQNGNINPQRLKCGTLTDQATRWYEQNGKRLKDLE